MMRKFKLKKVASLVMAGALSLTMIGTVTGCSVLDSIMGIFNTETPAEPTTVTLNETAVTIGVGDNKRLSADVSDDSDVVWSSSDESIATVSTSGVVKGIAAGKATITATANGVSATCEVTVELITVSLDKTELTLDIEIEEEKTATLVATVMKDGTALDEEIIWSSDAEDVATVDANGVVTAVKEGTTTIKAKRKNGNAFAECVVTVGWKNKPAGYAPIGYSEQNKAVTNTYGLWNDQGWEFANTTVYDAYYANSATSQAGKAVVDFEVLSKIKDEVSAAIQLIYRSSTATGDEGAMLDVGYFYTLTMDITSTVAGTVHVNDFAVNSEIEELKDEVYEFDLEANVTKTVTVKFAHYDDGRIHDTTDYSNVESALHLLLGSLEGRAKVTIDNLQWVKGDVAPERPNTTPSAPTVTIPDLSETEAIALDINADNAKTGEGNSGNEVYEITMTDEGKSYTVGYSGTWGATYSHIVVPIPETVDVANSNMFSVKVKNNGDAAMTIRFDIAGVAYDNGTNPASRDCALSAVATVGSPSVDLNWDGTALTVAAGTESVLYITYETTSDAGVPSELLVYFDTVYEAAPAEHSGNVTIGEFKFAYWEAPEVEEEPEAGAPDLDGVDSIALNVSADNMDNGEAAETEVGSYNITDNGDGKSYTIEYVSYTSTYQNIVVDLANTDVANCNTFAVTIKNNGASAIQIRFDLAGVTVDMEGVMSYAKDCALSSTATVGTPNTDTTNDGTMITVDPGVETTLYITYTTTGVHGVPTQLLIYCNTGWYGTAESNWAALKEERSGNVTISDFKFVNVEEEASA